MKIIPLLFASFVSFSAFAQTVDYDQKLKELGVELSSPAKPFANYVTVVRSGNLLFFSGTGPVRADKTLITGKVGKDLTIEEGYAAAKQTGVALLSALKAEIGDLNKVVRIVKVFGMVNCTPEFIDQPKVINGFSDLMVSVFGDKGKHARSAVGMVSLPMNIAVEIEMVVEVK